MLIEQNEAHWNGRPSLTNPTELGLVVSPSPLPSFSNHFFALAIINLTRQLLHALFTHAATLQQPCTGAALVHSKTLRCETRMPLLSGIHHLFDPARCVSV